MSDKKHFTRRRFLTALTVGIAALSSIGSVLIGRRRNMPDADAASAAVARSPLPTPAISPDTLLAELPYGQVQLGEGIDKWMLGKGDAAQTQFVSTLDVLTRLDEDSMLKPYRERAGLPAPGKDLGGWYDNFAGYDWHSQDGHGFAPGHCFGQWLSALARAYAITGVPSVKERVDRLVHGYAETISPKFYQDFRFPAYTYDKLLRGLLDAHLLTGNQQAWDALQKTTDTARPFLPNRPIDREDPPPGRDVSFSWDEPYTCPEHLFMTYLQGGGDRYRDLAKLLLIDKVFFTPLSHGENVLNGKHAYSHCNALSSAIQAYLVLGSEEHLQAAKNAFDIITDSQSFATGGWGPDETFIEKGSGILGKSLTSTHNSFETPCGAFAHFKLTRYLLRITRQAKYGDSMERVMYNTALGARPLDVDGSTFYYSDYNFQGKKVYHKDKFPCCAGTLPQVATDHHVNIYFTDKDGLYVNLYLNSTANFMHNGKRVAIKQTGDYPFTDDTTKIVFDKAGDQPFAMRFRIPSWTKGASLKINGKPAGVPLTPGTFAEVHRTWKAGDAIELKLPMSKRLEAVDPQHPNVVALMHGPLVLMAITEQAPSITRKALLEAKRSTDNPETWIVSTGKDDELRLLPFTYIQEEMYSTYLKVL